MTLTGSLDAAGVSALFPVRAQESFDLTLAVAEGEAHVGTVALERSSNGVIWEVVKDAASADVKFTGTADPDEPLEDTVFEGVITNETTKRQFYRVRAIGTAESTDAVTYALESRAGDVLATILKDHLNRPVLAVRDDGGVQVLGPALIFPSGVPSKVTSTIELAAPDGFTQEVTITLRDRSGAVCPHGIARLHLAQTAGGAQHVESFAQGKPTATVSAGAFKDGNDSGEYTGLTYTAITIAGDANGQVIFMLDNEGGGSDPLDAFFDLVCSDGIVSSEQLDLPGS